MDTSFLWCSCFTQRCVCRLESTLLVEIRVETLCFFWIQPQQRWRGFPSTPVTDRLHESTDWARNTSALASLLHTILCAFLATVSGAVALEPIKNLNPEPFLLRANNMILTTNQFATTRSCLLAQDLLLLHFYHQSSHFSQTAPSFSAPASLNGWTRPSSDAVALLKDATLTWVSHGVSAEHTISAMPYQSRPCRTPHSRSHSVSPSSLFSDGEERFKARFTLCPPARLWEHFCFGHHCFVSFLSE